MTSQSASGQQQIAQKCEFWVMPDRDLSITVLSIQTRFTVVERVIQGFHLFLHAFDPLEMFAS